MKSFFKIAKCLRVTVALAVFVLISAQFVDIYHNLPKSYFKWNPTATQFLPSFLKLLSGTAVLSCWAFFTWTFIALILGRAYCSFACPFGILMDIFRKIAIFPAVSKKLKKTSIGKFCQKKFAVYRFSKARNIMRGSFLIIAILCIVAGYTSLLGLIDPYSLYGKFMGGIVHPSVAMFTDWLGLTLSKFDIYAIPSTNGNPEVPLAAFGLALIILFGLLISSALRGRLYCNTICPVGTFLGMLSKFSLFKISLDESTCVSCGMCERLCKTQCIDSKAKTLDYSRCVDCFNCGVQCPKNAIKIKSVFSKKSEKESSENFSSNRKTVKEKSVSLSRRDFPKRFAGLLAILGLSAKAEAQMRQQKRKRNCGTCEVDENLYTPYKKKGTRPDYRITLPPGAESLENFAEHCTGCQICVSACKSQMLKPSISEYGLAGFMQPYMDFNEGFCLYDCHSCTKVCPTGALKFLTGKQKRKTKIGTAIFKPSLCVVKTDGTDCSACGEHCPVQAIEMIPFGDKSKSLFIPKVHEDVCIGCGACEYVCPVAPHKAIMVRGLRVHVEAVEFKESMRFYKAPKKEEKKTEPKPLPADNPFPF